jgi:hypothetical protein
MINTMSPTDYAVCISAVAVAAACLPLLFVETKRVGKITFWRLGRLGGSIHIARKHPPIKSRRGKQQLNGKLLPCHFTNGVAR